MKFEKVSSRFEDEEMLQKFLTEWPIDRLAGITLRQYNDTGDKETFCQYVETKTRALGSIKGSNSTKFGIYKRLNKDKKPKGTKSDDNYTWVRHYNDQSLNAHIAFEQVISEVQQIANLAATGDFEAIEHFRLRSMFRWKIAFLYSDNRLIPIFSKLNLIQIVNRMGMNASYHTPYYQMQQFLMARKPFDKTVVEYMRDLYTEHRIKIDKVKKPRRPASGRRGVTRKGTGPQNRRGHEAYTASQFHNEIQTALYEQLCDKYGKGCVNMELDWVDILVELPQKIILYEIKSDRYASGCIINGLGQILGYAFRARERYQKKIELIIAGANAGFDNEQEIVDFIFDQVKMPISYLKIEY
ncbi:hypothetical protein [Mucilaginibacter sp. AK015]|uniref:hypothetical protein n=1 Tax=Mucilaginibacter sp. AK015 TaxID=2723072 RepID=UPI00160F9002|nr:hypothetical protein [Mucilaginibacter sp. AK015]MBB5396689.1 hypothetical protein [Mucilaginibacter sp. AK015]